jgi:phosphotransferase system IIB component
MIAGAQKRNRGGKSCKDCARRIRVFSKRKTKISKSRIKTNRGKHLFDSKTTQTAMNTIIEPAADIKKASLTHLLKVKIL